MQPALTYGCAAAPLSSADAMQHSTTQAGIIKAALGLHRCAHHSALLAAAGIAPAHELIRAACFRAVSCAMKSEHRLRRALLSGLAKLATCSVSLGGSLLAQLSRMCGEDLAAVLEVVAGRPHTQRVTPPRAPDGLLDSIRFLLSDTSQASRRLLRLLTCDGSREPRRVSA